MTGSSLRRDGFAPIEAYALIGDKRSAALVARDGAIDWWCPTGFDGPSVFGALLDPGRGGSFSLAPAAPFTATRRYRPATNVLETEMTTADGVVRVTDAMALPLARSLDHAEIVRRVDGLTGSVPLRWRVAPRFGYDQTVGTTSGAGAATTIGGDDHVIVVQAHRAGHHQRGTGEVCGEFTCRAGDVATFAVDSFDAGPVSLSPHEHLADRIESTADRWSRWAAGCTYDGPWRDAVLRSAMTLDLMVDARTSGIVAAPTMGLPERVGGPKNYDYRYAWLRDGSLTLEAMLRLGFGEQVHASLAWMFRATKATHPWLRPMYALDGHVEIPDRELDLEGYRGSRPVRLGNSAQTQLQLGSYADVLDMVWHYVDDGNRLTGAAGQRLAELADFVCQTWDRPDSGLWELGETLHYTQSKMACAFALARADALAGRGVIPAGSRDRWRATEATIIRDVHDRCWDAGRGTYVRSPGSSKLDAGVLLGARGGMLTHELDRLSSTIDTVRRELGAGGPLLYRYTGMEEEEGAFLACSFWAAEALARCGRLDEAETMLDELVGFANDVGQFSEQIDPATGGLLGNMPQALTHLAFVNAAYILQGERAAASSGGGGAIP